MMPKKHQDTRTSSHEPEVVRFGHFWCKAPVEDYFEGRRPVLASSGVGGESTPKQKKPRGRSLKYPMPEPLDVDMDTLAEVVLKAKPKEVWRYEQESGRKPSKDQTGGSG